MLRDIGLYLGIYTGLLLNLAFVLTIYYIVSYWLKTIYRGYEND